jgi:hypothetical protein
MSLPLQRRDRQQLRGSSQRVLDDLFEVAAAALARETRSASHARGFTRTLRNDPS